MFKLDKRLRQVAEFVEKDAVVADIGCDHGYLAANLILSEKASYCYACDLNENPLRAAKYLVEEYGLEENIKTVLTSGVEGLPLQKISCIVVAGMGGDLIARIIEAEPMLKDRRFNFVLQPMSKHEHLRSYLFEHGFEILREAAVEQKRNMYSIMQVQYTGETHTPTEAKLLIGSMPREVFAQNLEYVRYQQKKIEKALAGIAKTKELTEKDEEKAANLQKTLEDISKTAKEMEKCTNL